MATARRPKYIITDGYRLDDSFLPGNFRSATNFQPRSDDVIVATYPKSGTTWMCHIVLLLLNRGDLPVDDSYFKRCIFLEYEGAEAVRDMIKPGCIKIHLPFDRITYSSKAKYIYVARHPRDVVVSFYHHTKHFPNYYFSDGTFSDFFEIFLKGETDFNDYFDNLISWYEQRHQSNIFLTTFEAMTADSRGVILKVAEFLGPQYHSDLLADNSRLLEEVLLKSSIDYMKKTVSKVVDSHFMCPSGDDPVSRTTRDMMQKAILDGQTSEGDFVRDGKVGSGKIVLSEDMEFRLQQRILEKTKNSDVMTLWNENSN